MNEIVALSKRERDRLVILRQVKEGKLTQAAAARQLKLSALGEKASQAAARAAVEPGA